jgi:hypothetical protein
MFEDRDALAAYRLLEFPNETAQSWPIAKRKLNELPMGLLERIPFARVPSAREAGRSDDAAKKIAA